MNQQKASDGAIKVLLKDLKSDGNALRTILIKHIHSKTYVISNISSFMTPTFIHIGFLRSKYKILV